MHKSTIKVLARSRPGVNVSSLMEMFSCVVSGVLTVRANHAPGVDAYSVFRVMERALQENTLYQSPQSLMLFKPVECLLTPENVHLSWFH